MKIEDEGDEYLEREICILDALPLYLNLIFSDFLSWRDCMVTFLFLS